MQGMSMSQEHLSCSLNSFKGSYIRDYIGEGLIEGDTKSSDYGSFSPEAFVPSAPKPYAVAVGSFPK